MLTRSLKNQTCLHAIDSLLHIENLFSALNSFSIRNINLKIQANYDSESALPANHSALSR